MNRSLLILAAVALFTFPAFGQATRTWVSGVGDDINPCSRTAPCKTFAGAISKTACGGEINVLDSGGYGTVTITKSITIDGAGAHASILASSTNGVIINLASTSCQGSVTLRNLSINGTYNGLDGIRVLNSQAPAFAGPLKVTIQNLYIGNFTGDGIDVNPNVLTRLHVSDTTIERTANAVNLAANAMGTSGEFNRMHIWLNNNGIIAGTGAHISVRDSVVSLSAANGIQTTGSNVDVSVEQTTVSHNLTGLNVAAGTNLRVGLSQVTDNAALGAGTIQTHGDNHIAGNGAGGTLSLINTQ